MHYFGLGCSCPIYRNEDNHDYITKGNKLKQKQQLKERFYITSYLQVPHRPGEACVTVGRKKCRFQAVFKRTMPPDFFSTQPQHTLQKDKPYQEIPLIRDCCNHKGSFTLFIPYNHRSQDQLLKFQTSFYKTISSEFLVQGNFKHTQFSREHWYWLDSNSQPLAPKVKALSIELTWLLIILGKTQSSWLGSLKYTLFTHAWSKKHKTRVVSSGWTESELRFQKLPVFSKKKGHILLWTLVSDKILFEMWQLNLVKFLFWCIFSSKGWIVITIRVYFGNLWS